MPDVKVSQALTDPLSDIATGSGLQCTGVERWNLKRPWGIRYAGSDQAVLHCVVRGEAMVIGLGDEPIRIAQGGTALLPRDVPHVIASRWPLEDHHMVEVPAEPLPLHGVRNFDAGAAQPDTIVVTMPFVVPGREPAAPPAGTDERSVADAPQIKVLGVPGEDLLEMLVLVAKLSLMPGLGDRYVACRLSEAILAKVLQRLAGAEEDTLGLFGLFASVGIRSALGAIEGDVAHGWTVGELAEIAGMPRAAFKAEFRDTVGTSVREFIDLRRIRSAQSRLAQGVGTLTDAAAAVGFRSKTSLRKALGTLSGLRPGPRLRSLD